MPPILAILMIMIGYVFSLLEGLPLAGNSWELEFDLRANCGKGLMLGVSLDTTW
jgi:hypothetical protein